MLSIYIDQNKWIRLLQQRENSVPPHEEQIPDVLKFVEQTSDRADIAYVIDWVRLQESAARNDTQSREHLFDFMWEISNGWSFPPYNIVRDEEVVAAVKRRLGEEYDLDRRILNRGSVHMAGGQNFVVENDEGESFFDVMDEGDIKEFFESIQSEKAFKQGLLNDEMIETLREIHDYDEAANHLSGWGDDLPEEYDEFEQQRRAVHLQHFVHTTGKDYFEYGQKEGLSVPELSFNLGNYLKRGKKASQAEQHLMEFPSAFVFNELRFRRDKEGKPFDNNDIRDLTSLSVAIPYSHVVICEKHFASIAKQSNLHEKFDTIITSDLKDLLDLGNHTQ